ncbi:unnamed protein product, partial [Scytosiphon promiscuus]
WKKDAGLLQQRRLFQRSNRTLRMLDALVVLCCVLGVFFWWLAKNYDTSSSEQDPRDEQEKPVSGRRRGRGRNKKGRDKDKNAKTTKVQQLSAADTASTDVQRSVKSRRPGKQQLDAQEWPTLGADNDQGLPYQQEEEEDLAVLHAKMLNAARSSPPGGSHKDGSTADRRGTVAGGRRTRGRIGVGDKVEGRYEAGAEWFPAVVTKTLHGGLVNLLYDDGERETRVPLNLVRHRGSVAGTPSDDSESSSESDDSSEEEAGVRNFPAVAPETSRKQADGWEDRQRLNAIAGDGSETEEDEGGTNRVAGRGELEFEK